MIFIWTQIDAFYEINRIMDCDTLLTHIEFNETSKIHTDARKFQLAEFISQKGKPIDFRSNKLTDDQKS